MIRDSEPEVSVFSASDVERLEALEELQIIDSGPEPVFDDVVQIASTVCNAPVALISFVQEERQWFKARIGFPPAETPIDQSVCRYSLNSDDLLIIPDLTKDPRTSSNALVTQDPFIRFYAGARLVLSDGIAVGALCIIDHVPRPEGLTREQRSVLKALAGQISAHLELRRAANRQREILERQKQINAMMRDSVRTALTAQEAGRIGTFELDVETGNIKVSAEFCRIFDVPPVGHYHARDFEKMLHPDDRGRESSEETRKSGTAVTTVEYRIVTASRGVRWVSRQATFERDETGKPVKLLGTVQDITQQKRATERIRTLLELGDRLRDLTDVEEIALTAAELMAHALDATRAGFGVVDPVRETVMMQPEWRAPGVSSLAGKHYFRDYGSYIDDLKGGMSVVISDVTTDPRTKDKADALLAIGIRQLVNVPIFDQGKFALVVFVHHCDLFEWMDDDLAFVRSFGDRIQSAIGRLRAEAEQNLLNREIGHRLKNAFAMVQALAKQTLRPVQERGPVLNFEQRLQALSSAHDILLGNNWANADVRTVLLRVIDTLGMTEQVDIRGDDISVNPKGALSLSLLFHELTTNAVKYGSLSSLQGRVLVAWDVEGGREDAVFRLIWRETGGPPVVQPQSKGFGSRLISMGLLGTGGVSTRYLDQGLEVEMTASLVQLQQVA
ncbi:GAF domain-containing protein [Agrobacterium larrymoorei]|uniref:GAF domain-containing protein n=1 Tax=Agrobacterium larrymoorei TaxID=160699 RepID=UPI0030BD89AA